MAWTSPKTFAANSTLSAVDLNTYLRDNLLETTAAKATTAGGMFVTSGNNVIAERVAAADFVPTSQSTSSISATGADLSTFGPSVTVTTGTKAFVFLYCHGYWTATAGRRQVFMMYSVTGPISIVPDHSRAIVISHTTTNRGQRVGLCVLQDGLGPGTNVFTAKYSVDATTSSALANFSDRRIAVLPF
jgi:hypothetical protein